MKRRLEKALLSSGGLVAVLLVVSIKEGAVPWPLLGLVVAFFVLFLGFAWVEEAGERRHERAVLASLARLGGSATLSELEASLFDATTAFASVQRRRDAIARLLEDGRIVQADDRLRLKR